jgi:predicted nucleic acid-binding protein
MPRTIYLDSSVVLAYLKNEKGRVDVIDAVITEATRKTSDFQLITSAISLVEVAYVEQQDSTVEEGFREIDEFWESVPIKIVEVNQINALEGRRLLRARAMANPNPQSPQPKKRAADALHLGTAIWLESDEFWTYDVDDFGKYQVDFLTVCIPFSDQTPLPLSEIE